MNDAYRSTRTLRDKILRDLVRTVINADNKPSVMEDLTELGPPAIPYLLEVVAMTGDHSKGLVTMAALAVLDDVVRGELIDAHEICFPYDRVRVLLWGRENRYLLDWLCPDCRLGYDMHIQYPCEHIDGQSLYSWVIPIQKIVSWSHVAITVSGSRSVAMRVDS